MPSNPAAGSLLPERNRAALLLGSAGVAAIGFITFLRIVQVNRLVDQGHFAKYSHFVNAILAGDLPLHRLGDLSPGYLWSLVALEGLLGLGVNGVRTLQLTMIGLVAVMVALTAYRLTGGLAAVVAAVAVLANRAALLNATEIEPETLILVLNCAGCCLVVLSRDRRWVIALAGLCLGLSAITRPSVLPAALLMAGCCWWRRSRGAPDGPSCGLAGRLAGSCPLLLLAGLLLPLLVLRVTYSAVPGAGRVMNPGTVFYEGANPATTGYIGTAPRIVKDLEPGLQEPDALHLSYRLVARRALGNEADRAAVNAFWLARAHGFITSYPGAFTRLLGRKLLLAVKSYDAHDLLTVVRKEQELGSWQWLPFGAVFGLAAVGAVLSRHRWVALLLSLYLSSYLVVMLVFYVSARQRNPMLPALALLAGCAAHELVELWRRRAAVRLTTALAAVVMQVVLLGHEGRVQREDRHDWMLADRVERIARSRELGVAARDVQVGIVLHLGELASPVPAQLVRAAVNRELATPLTLARRFDLAVVCTRIADWPTADRLLHQLEQAGYRPSRGGTVTSSLAFHRARCALRLGNRRQLPQLLEQAHREAPGDARVLALLAATGVSCGTRSPRQLLVALHDPFTAGLATAEAWRDLGEHSRAEQQLAELRQRFPEWHRPARHLGPHATEPTTE